MELENIIKKYDREDLKQFSLSDIHSEICHLDSNEKTNPNFLNENLAFGLSLIPDSDGNGYSFGPLYSFADSEGKVIVSADENQITPEVIDYWISRYQSVKNPLLKLHYAGLVWNYHKIKGEKKPKDLYVTYVEYLCKACEEDYFFHPTETVKFLEQLFNLTHSNDTYKERVKSICNSFEHKYSSDDTAVRYWSFKLYLIINYRQSFSKEEIDKTIECHESRLKRLMSIDIENTNPWLIKDQCFVLAEYYHAIGDNENLIRILKLVEDTFLKLKERLSPFQLYGNLKQIQQLYHNYNLQIQETELTTNIQSLGGNILGDLKEIKIDYDVSKEVCDLANSLFGDVAISEEEKWNNFINYFIPHKKKEEMHLAELVSKYPLVYFSATQIFDPKGHPLSFIEPYDKDHEGNLILHISNTINIRMYFLSLAISNLKKSGALDVEKIMDLFVKKSTVIDSDRYVFIASSIGFFLQEEYVMFCHTIIPQIEHALINLAEQGGEIILKPQKKGKGFQLVVLDSILRTETIINTFTEEGAFYLRLILTDQRAFNIRNYLCHGIYPPQYFSVESAMLLFHVLILICSKCQ